MEKNTSKSKMLKKIMNTEAARENGKYMRRYFPKGTESKAVDKVTFTISSGVSKEATAPAEIV